MSVNSQPEESVNWEPSEIAESLQSLGISPPQTLDEHFLSTPSNSDENSNDIDNREETKISHRNFESESPVNFGSDRETIIGKLRVAKEDIKYIEWKNNYLHEYLVEHFRRKQMMHVCTNESEDDSLLNEYLTKLDELERSNEELRGSREDWDAEITRTRDDIQKKEEDARKSVNEMIAEERRVGTSTWYCGKPLSIKRVQALIARQLDRIKDIAKFRIHYARLRDEYVAIEGELKRWAMSSPNLTKEDYKRLEDEQFRYKQELTIVERQCDEYRKRRDKLAVLVNSTRGKIIRIKGAIDYCERIIANLKNSIRAQLEERKICLAKLADAKYFIRRYNEMIEPTERPEFAMRMTKIREEHDKWLQKMSFALKEIENRQRSINALRANLILCGKDLGESPKFVRIVSEKDRDSSV